MSFINGPVFNRVIVPLSLVSSVCGGILLLRETKGGKKCPNTNRVDGKVVVITGANSGIGKETAKEVAKRGATVILGCRHMGKCEDAAVEIRRLSENKHVVCRFLNLADLNSVKEFAETIQKELPHIDVLVNNAGVLKPRPPKTTFKTDDGFERQFGVNHLGHFLLTNLLLEKLTNGEEPGRVINITSDAYKQGSIDLENIDKSDVEGEERLNQLYYQSKLANVLFTDSLNRRSKSEYNEKLVSNCIHPGIVDTNISQYSTVPFYVAPMYSLFKPFKLLTAMKTPLQGAQTSIHLATDPSLTHKSGWYYSDCESIAPTCDLCDGDLADQLWKKCEEWTDLAERRNKIKPKNQNNIATSDVKKISQKQTSS
ncbi:retinol dehydrogenase 13-like [Clavelina lepadiformis]|uniref:retinol dehydrogenase 13-like n=1 Tax=Clavelina lepadiformis TaxID=159417 RepID=UPI0040424E71